MWACKRTAGGARDNASCNASGRVRWCASVAASVADPPRLLFFSLLVGGASSASFPCSPIVASSAARVATHRATASAASSLV
eukprot:CAMPEP_0174711836 /NCGR_PEP_ID=MMETSP1094-20130205/13035_1 /TAXON_ID=156173 /ORGANISM="Chrysochromulina brevifilum, Strain UTEX LB 985" /LENGTH=81 /DNA_ID=CAMNT_0015910833 /DNA_START=308 /DNA_END=553 /DNA_ORIENTATION=-